MAFSDPGSFTPFDVLTAAEMQVIADNQRGFNDGTALGVGSIPTAAYADVSVTSEKLAEAFFKGRKQDDTTNSDISGYKVMHGWGYIQGNGTTKIQETVTFPTAFSSAPVVLITHLGFNGSAPTAISDFQSSSGSGSLIGAYTEDIVAASFQAGLTSSSANLSSSNYWGYSWIALGPA